MAKADIRKSIFRVLSDLIKSDNIITIDEIDCLDEVCKKFGITEQDREESYKISLSSAVATLSKQNNRVKKKRAQGNGRHRAEGRRMLPSRIPAYLDHRTDLRG